MQLTSALRCWCVFSILLLTLGFSVDAQNALVLKNTNLRKDPSTKHQPIELLQIDDELQILDQTTDPNYLKVRAEDRKTGWVWRKAVEIIPDPNGNVPPSPPSPSPNPNPSPNAGPISPDWPKPDPMDGDFQGSEGTCGPTGDGGDTATNARKNRTDPLPAVHDVTWNAIASLAYPAAPASRASWTAAQLNQIKPFEGVAIRTTGFLSHAVSVETTGSGESTNCHFHQPEDVDWHVYLVEHPTGDGMDKAVIVETTPRMRMNHQWDSTVLDSLVNTGKPIRVSGFLMLDPEHRNQVGKYRITVWEIHPITQIEVCDNTSCADNEWVPLDQKH